jgi:hypothetical protein
MREVIFETANGGVTRTPYDHINYDPDDERIFVVLNDTRRVLLTPVVTESGVREALSAESPVVNLSRCAEFVGVDSFETDNADPRESDDDATRRSPAPAPKDVPHHPEG